MLLCKSLQSIRLKTNQPTSTLYSYPCVFSFKPWMWTFLLVHFPPKVLTTRFFQNCFFFSLPVVSVLLWWFLTIITNSLHLGSQVLLVTPCRFLHLSGMQICNLETRNSYHGTVCVKKTGPKSHLATPLSGDTKMRICVFFKLHLTFIPYHCQCDCVWASMLHSKITSVNLLNRAQVAKLLEEDFIRKHVATLTSQLIEEKLKDLHIGNGVSDHYAEASDDVVASCCGVYPQDKFSLQDYMTPVVHHELGELPSLKNSPSEIMRRLMLPLQGKP